MFQQKRNITEMYRRDKGAGSGGEGRGACEEDLSSLLKV